MEVEISPEGCSPRGIWLLPEVCLMERNRGAWCVVTGEIGAVEEKVLDHAPIWLRAPFRLRIWRNDETLLIDIVFFFFFSFLVCVDGLIQKCVNPASISGKKNHQKEKKKKKKTR
eukprot:TRINITY_DN500_c1_g1_i1.p1 TRINITY_DN500_c1_g1~~TRINITY_DN500_c1_g1_i1.p1  ORF type:complete len:115 (+),score=16.38 TRINITY_DN500_c1_g1_i1:175-519(+)